MNPGSATFALALLLLGAGQGDPVRTLTLKDPQRTLPEGGGSERLVFADAQALKKGLEERVLHKYEKVFVKLTAAERTAIAERMAGELGAQVDFSKERIVWVQWGTSGPPYGKLCHEIQEKKAVFYVQAPDAVERGERSKSGHGFFAVAAELTSTLESRERPPK